MKCYILNRVCQASPEWGKGGKSGYIKTNMPSDIADPSDETKKNKKCHVILLTLLKKPNKTKHAK